MDFQLSTPQQLRQFIVGLRTQAGYSQAEAGEQLGISQQTYQRIEKQPHKTSIERLMLILKLFNAALIVRDNVSASLARADDSGTESTIKEAKRDSPSAARPDASNRQNVNTKRGKDKQLIVPATGKKVDW